MIHKLFVLVLAAAAASTGFAQTPEPRTGGESRVFSYLFDGSGGYLGVRTEEVTKENAGKYNLSEAVGVAVAEVLDNSPAQAAGLQSGDVVVKFNGEEVTSVRKLTRLLAEVAPDHKVKLTILRNGDSRELTVAVGKRPAAKFADEGFALPPLDDRGAIILTPERMELPPTGRFPALPDMPPLGNDSRSIVGGLRGGPQIGTNVSPLTKQLADRFGVANGVLVNEVRENSPAAKAGLTAGDVIVAVNGKDVNSVIDLAWAVRAGKGSEIEIGFVRDRSRQTVRLKPEEVKGVSDFEFSNAVPGLIGPLNRAAPKAPAAPLWPNKIFSAGRIL